MGGKHKTANRTKNNARPSNSGRSAELLGTSIPQFVGFSGIKDSAFGFSVTSTEELEASVDPNIQLILKKISKKDSTTKIKGLQEFAECIKSSEPDVLKAILPVWPRFYNILATDVDSRVREATHSVHHQIILKAKRNIAPYLKQLMAPWFTSQYDSYPPAASVASQAFKDAFPPNKIEEAIVYCQEEILAYINDNLLVQTAQTLSNLKHVSAEEAEAKYERVLIACLQGYCLYLEKVSPEHIHKANDLNHNIVANPKYWKLAKHKLAQVRSAWFKVLSIICQKAVFLLDGKGAQVTATVFGNIEEYDPTVLPTVWEAVLLTMSTIKEWWTYVNIEKVFFPKLWKVLKQGGQGNATAIYPSLLPLISHLPPTVDENASQFYNTFFEHLRNGLKQKSTISSKSESAAVATSFTECLQYIILKKQNDIVLCKNLIKNHLIATIEWCLLEDQTSYKIIFNQVSSLIQYWSRNSDKSEPLKTYLDFFFEHIADLFKETLYNFKEIPCFDVNNVSTKQLEFLQSLKHTVKSKKLFKVKFSLESSEASEEHQHYTASIVDYDQTYFEKLNLLVFNVCENYVKYIEDKHSKQLFEYLCSLMIDFSTKDFFINLNEKMKKKNPDSKLIDIYHNLLYKWYKSEDLCCKYVVDLIFLLFEHVNSDEKKFMLDNLLQDSNDDSLSWCISEALSHPHNKDILVKEFLQNDKISDFIVSIADKEINGTCSPELSNLFKLALTENENGELFVQNAAITRIVDKLIVTMENYKDYPLTADTCVSLAAYTSAIIYTENLLLTYNDTLLLALFRLSCISDINSEVISTETLYEVSTAWQDTITLLTKSMSKEETMTLTLKFAELVENHFLKEGLQETSLNHLISNIVSYLRAVYRSLPLAITEYLFIFLNRNFTKLWRSDVYRLCMGAEYVQGNLCSPYEEIEKPSQDLKEVNMARYFAGVYVITGVVATSLEETEDEDDEEDGEKSTEVNILNVIDNCEEFFAQILHDLSVCRTYLDFFTNTKHFDLVLHFYVLTEMKIKSMLENSDKDFKTKLKTVLKEKSIEKGWFWCKAVSILYKDFIPESLTEIYSSFVSDLPLEESSLGYLHLTQVLSDSLDYSYVYGRRDLVSDVVILNSLIRCEEIEVQIAEVFHKIEKLRRENVAQFLYDQSACTPWPKLQEIIEVIKLCSSLIKEKFSCLEQKHWDFAVLSLVSWTSNCLRARASFEKYQFQALLAAVVKLFVNTDNQIIKMSEEGLKNNYIGEWKDVLFESIHCCLAQVWLYLAEQLEEKNEDITYLPIIQEFGLVVSNIKENYLFGISDTSLPKWTKFLKKSCSLLISPQPSLQIWGYKMLLKLVPGLIKIDAEAVDTNTPHKKGLIFEQFKEKLVETQEIVNSMLLGFKLGEDSCRVKPSTDSFTYTFAYLLIWDILLTLCELASTELRYQYADWLRNEDLLRNFLNNLFRLMPTEVLQYKEGKSKSLLELFLRKPDMSLRETCDSDKIEALVCWLYSSTLTQLPALVRQWWTSLDTKISQIVEKVTSMYISPHLCVKELNEVMTYQSKFKNMSLKVMQSVREVIAIYTVDEAQVELIITLPVNYPLGGLEVQCNSHKQWLLQFKKCVLHQNGRIWDGLSLWNNNLDKKFDGVEECYICFAVLHPGTYQLPKLSCQTCKKKFHSACLYKWFRTSYKSSCPICRNLF